MISHVAKSTHSSDPTPPPSAHPGSHGVWLNAGVPEWRTANSLDVQLHGAVVVLVEVDVVVVVEVDVVVVVLVLVDVVGVFTTHVAFLHDLDFFVALLIVDVWSSHL